jgi:hypothetical protein
MNEKKMGQWITFQLAYKGRKTIKARVRLRDNTTTHLNSNGPTRMLIRLPFGYCIAALQVPTTSVTAPMFIIKV